MSYIDKSSQILPADITAIILTYNEEQHIERCILSIKNIVSKIIVLDSFSSDGTLDILKKYNVEVLQNKSITHFKLLNWVLDTANIKTNWILKIDADEILSEGLAKKISENLDNYPTHISGITINRQLIFLKKKIRFGGFFPHRSLRIWRNGRGKCQATLQDEQIIVDADIAHIEEDIIDNNLNNLSRWMAKHKKYAPKEASNYFFKKRNFNKNEILKMDNKTKYKKIIKFKIYYNLPMVLRPLLFFLYVYFFRLGFLDGWRGLVFHSLQTFWYRLLVDLKIIELKKIMKRDKLTLEQLLKSKYGLDI